MIDTEYFRTSAESAIMVDIITRLDKGETPDAAFQGACDALDNLIRTEVRDAAIANVRIEVYVVATQRLQNKIAKAEGMIEEFHRTYPSPATLKLVYDIKEALR